MPHLTPYRGSSEGKSQSGWEDWNDSTAEPATQTTVENPGQNQELARAGNANETSISALGSQSVTDVDEMINFVTVL